MPAEKVADRRRVAVFGGSFNPPHVAHQMVALWTLETQPVDELIAVPAFRHPFDKPLTSFAHRLEMCRLAMAPLGARVSVSAIEEQLDDGRTLIMLEALARTRPDADLRFVIGADILKERDKWYRWGDVERLAPPIIVGRCGHPVPEAGALIELPAISSTEIRARAASGAPLEPLVSTAVAAYIEEHALYRQP